MRRPVRPVPPNENRVEVGLGFDASALSDEVGDGGRERLLALAVGLGGCLRHEGAPFESWVRASTTEALTQRAEGGAESPLHDLWLSYVRKGRWPRLGGTATLYGCNPYVEVF